MEVREHATLLLNRMSRGDRQAAEELGPLLETELGKLARGHLGREAKHHTLDATELVHEAFVRLIRTDEQAYESRQQFFALASHVMRSVLVDHARAKGARKRSASGVRVTLAPIAAADTSPLDVLAVDEALSALAEMDEELGRIAELRLFGGLDTDEIGEAVGLPRRTVQRRWKVASAWLSKRLVAE